MTYLTPRHGLFAVIITLSFILHTQLLVISTKQQINDMNRHTVQHIAEQLIQESTIALSSKDKVSLGVLANRYTNEFDIASLIITDADNTVLVRIGDAPLQQGQQISRIATLGDTALGEVTVTLKEVSSAEIISSQWLFILGALIIHLLLWLLYGYIARPTKAQLSEFSRQIQERIMAQQSHPLRARRGEPISPQGDISANPNNNNNKHNNKHITKDSGEIAQQAGTAFAHDSSENETTQNRQAANAKLQQNAPLNVLEAVNNYIHSYKNNPQNHPEATTPNYASSAKSTESSTPNHANLSQQLSANRSMTAITLQIHFDDKDNLLTTLAPEKSLPYFALCTQLLEQTITELIKLPLLYGVTLNNRPVFTIKGVYIELSAQDKLSKVGLAAVMLGKLYVMLNQIIYAKHRELKRFALKVNVGISDTALVKPMQQLIQYHAQTDSVLVLLPKAGIKQLNNHFQLQSLANPTTVYERECALVTGVNDAMMNRLVNVRNLVLLSG